MDDQAQSALDPSVDWSQFKPVDPQPEITSAKAPALDQSVDWSKFEPVPDSPEKLSDFTGSPLDKSIGAGAGAALSELGKLPWEISKAGYMGLGAIGKGVDAAQSAITGMPHTEASDWAFGKAKQMDEGIESIDDFRNDLADDHPTAVKVGSTVGSLARDMGLMVASEGMSAAPELAYTGANALRAGADIAANAVGRSAMASAPVALEQGLNTAGDVYDETGSGLAAANAGAGAFTGTTLANALPMSLEGRKLLRAGVGTIVGGITGEGQRQLVNAGLPDDMQQKFSWDDVATNAVFGGLLGTAFHGPGHVDPQVTALKYNDMRKAAETGNKVAEKAVDLVGDLSAVDGLTPESLDSASLGAKAGSDVHDASHDSLMQDSDRYRQIYDSAKPEMSPEEAQQYAKDAYASEVATNVAWDSYTAANANAVKVRADRQIADDIKSMLGMAREQVPPVEMQKMLRWAAVAKPAPLEIRDALRTTIEDGKAPDYVEDQHGEDFHDDGALTEKAYQDDTAGRDDNVSVTYKETPEVSGALKEAGIVPYRVADGHLTVAGEPDYTNAVVSHINQRTGQLPVAGEPHEIQLHPENVAEKQRPAEGLAGRKPAAVRPEAEDRQPVEADGNNQGRQTENAVTARSEPVAAGVESAGISEAHVTGKGEVVIHQDASPDQAQKAMDVAAADTFLEPTEGQIKSGNYRKGGVLFKSKAGDVRVRIENPDGSVRRGSWGSRKIRGIHYGYIPGTVSGDGEPVDVLLTRHAHDDSRKVAVISQRDVKTGLHDEIKVVMGAANKAEAMEAYLKQYPPGMHKKLIPNGKKDVVMMDRAKFNKYLQSRSTDVPPHPVSGAPMLSLRRTPEISPDVVASLKPKVGKIEDGTAFVRDDMADESVPVDKLTPTYEPSKTEKAERLMREAAAGEGERRWPLAVRKMADGTFQVLQGADTLAVAKTMGVTHLPVKIVDVEGDTSFLKPAGKLKPAESENLTTLFIAAARKKPKFDQTLSDIAHELDGEYLAPGMKGRVRSEEKIHDDYKGDAGSIKDLLRSSLVFRDPIDAEAAMRVVASKMKVVETKNGFNQPKGYKGYRDGKLIVDVGDGVKAEIQFHSRPMFDAKNNGGHALYEKYRRLRAFDPRRQLIKRNMDKLYGEAWESNLSALARKPNLSTSSSNRSREIGYADRSQSTSSSPSRARNSGPSSDNLTAGMSSPPKSKNFGKPLSTSESSSIDSLADGSVPRAQVKARDDAGLGEVKELHYDGESADQTAQFSWEAVPSTTIKGNEWIHNASPEVKLAYTKAINDAIGPTILEEFGIDHTGTTVGFGGWEGEVNPSIQEHVRFTDAQKVQLENAAATYGLLLKQDGVAYHVPEYGKNSAEENGVHVDAGRQLTSAETKAVYDRIIELGQERFGLDPGEAQSFAPIPNERGVRFLNFSDDVPNRGFAKMVTDALKGLPEGMDVHVRTFKSDGDLIYNNWSESPHGEGYVSRLHEAGGWDSARRTIDRLGPEVDRISKDFRQRVEKGEPVDTGTRERAQRSVEERDAHRVDVDNHVRKVASAFKGKATVTVHRSAADLPANDPVRTYLDRLLSDPDVDVGGVYYNGHVYLFSDSLASKAEAETVLMHEMIGHGGPRSVFGDAFKGMLDQLHPFVKNTPLYKSLHELYAGNYPDSDRQSIDRAVTDEYLANIAQTGDHRSAFAKFVGMVRQWAREHGYVSKWTENDIRTMMAGVARDVRDGRVSVANLEPPTTTFNDDTGTATTTYVGKSGRGFVDHLKDGTRNLRVGGLDAHFATTVLGEGQYLSAFNTHFMEPSDLLALTRYAGEEGKAGVLIGKDEVTKADLDAAGIPFHELPGFYRLPASQGVDSPMFSMRNRAKGTPEQEAILSKAIDHSEYNMTPWDRMQKTMRELRDDIQSGDTALELKQGYVDALAPIAKYERGITGGQLLDAAQSPYKMSWMAKNNEQITAAVMRLGVPTYDKGSFVPVAGRKGLMDIFKPLYAGTPDGKPLDALWEGYAMARRSNELIGQLNADGTPKEKLLSQDEINTMLDLEKKYPFFKTVLDEYQTFNNQLLDLAVERGTLSAETAELWKNNTYVPFYRAMEDSNAQSADWRVKKGISGKKVTSHRLYGSQKMAEPIIENIIKNTGSILDKVYANEAMRRVVSVANGIGMERVKMPFSPVKLSVGEIERQLSRMGMHIGKTVNTGANAASGRYSRSVSKADAEQMATFFQMMRPVGSDIVSVMVKGKPVYYKVTDPSLYRAITAFNDIGRFDKVLGAILGVPKRVLTLGITLDPRFMYRNLIRDTITSWMQTGTNPNMFKDIVTNAKEVFNDGEFINSLRLAGYNGNEYFKVNAMREHLEEMHGKGWTVLNSPKKLFKAYHKIGFVSEQQNRLRIAKHTLDNGGSMAEAAWQAQNTLNFQMRGDNRAMQLLIRAVPFLNARVQGLNRLYDGALGRDVTGDRKRAVVSFAMKSAALLTASLLLAQHNADDPRYQRIPEAAKDTYYHFFLGDQHFVLPKPFELGAILGTLPERALRRIEGNDTTKTLMESVGRVLMGIFQFNPTPQGVAPMIEDWANKDMFSGRPIVSQSLENKLPEAQYTPTTSPSVKALAQSMPKVAPDVLRSPVRLEHALRGYFGTLGLYTMMMADATVRAMGNAPAAPASRWGNPLAGAIGGTFGMGKASNDPRTKYMQQLYDAQDEADKSAATLNQYIKEGNREEVQNLIQDHRTGLAYRKTIHTATKEMKGLREAEMAIYQSTVLTPEQKRDRLDKINQTRVKILDGMGPMLDMLTDYH